MPYATNPDDGVRIHYEEVGQGPPLLLNHGVFQSGDHWRRYGYVEALEDEFRLLLVDARGHGQSDKPHSVESYVIAVMVQDIIAVLDHAGVERANFYGYSMGGRTGYAFGLTAPDRVERLAIGGAYPSNRRPPHLRTWIDALREGIDAYIDVIESTFGITLPPERRAELEQADLLAWAACIEAGLADPSLEDEVPGLTMPVLILTGEEDASVYEQAREAARRIPDAELAILPGLGHLEAQARSDVALPHIQEFFRPSSQP